MASTAPLLQPVEVESPELQRLRGENKLLKASLSAFALVGALCGAAALSSHRGPPAGHSAFLEGGSAVPSLASPRPIAMPAAERKGDEEEVKIPEYFDTRNEWLGCGTTVVDQGQCGDCWSFSTTGSVEGLNSIKFGKLFSLSEQELVDCDVKFDHGCNGGLMDYAFDYILNNGGIDSERDYPYVSEDGHKEECKNKKETRDVGFITGWEDVPANDEKALMKAAAHQPVSVAIEADTFPFQFYSSGVLTSKACGTRLDHAVLVVGYGDDKETEQPYWIVKNSWGDTWGEEGYLRIARDPEGVGPGICGIAMAASYPTLDGNTTNLKGSGNPKASRNVILLQ